jgi:protein-S-isoprenylcysteine O-methyltransferase Ste14
MIGLLLLFLGWAMFYALHSALAHHSVKAFVQSKAKGHYRYYRLLFNLISVVFLSGLLVFQFSLPAETILQLPALLPIAGTLVFVLGLVVLVVAFASFNKAEFVGLQQLRLTDAPKQTQHQVTQLTKTGMYAYVRHPLYFGIVLLLVGALLYIPSYPMLVFVATSLIYLPIGVYLEEQKLIVEFGDAYRLYQKEAKRFIPFVY